MESMQPECDYWGQSKIHKVSFFRLYNSDH